MQASASALLRGRPGRGLVQALTAGAPALAVCGSLQLLGSVYLDASGREVDGLGLLDLETRASGPRCVGEVVARTADGLVLTGFENHAGRTVLGPDAEPLATVVRGSGNNGTDRTEGVRRGNLLGTYLHGPVLARNPAFADALLGGILERRGRRVDLAPIRPDPAAALHAERLRAASPGSRRPNWWRRRRTEAGPRRGQGVLRPGPDGTGA